MDAPALLELVTKSYTLASTGLSGEQALTAMNALLNTLQVCFLAYLAAKYQRPPS